MAWPTHLYAVFGQFIVCEKQWLPPLAQVPLHVIDQQEHEDVRPFPVGQAEVDRAHLQIACLQRPEGTLDPCEGHVTISSASAIWCNRGTAARLYAQYRDADALDRTGRSDAEAKGQRKHLE